MELADSMLSLRNSGDYAVRNSPGSAAKLAIKNLAGWEQLRGDTSAFRACNEADDFGECNFSAVHCAVLLALTGPTRVA